LPQEYLLGHYYAVFSAEFEVLVSVFFLEFLEFISIFQLNVGIAFRYVEDYLIIEKDLQGIVCK